MVGAKNIDLLKELICQDFFDALLLMEEEFMPICLIHSVLKVPELSGKS